MKKITLAFSALALLAGTAAPQSAEKKKVMCTLPILKSITDALSGGDFDVTALAKPDQDAHTVSPTPVLMNKLANADLFIEIGLQLELWADQVANGSNNANIMSGAKGRLIASDSITPEEVPKITDRKEGDVHPQGNPHIWLDPIRVRQIAENIAKGLSRIAPDKEKAIQERLKKFQDRIDEALFGADLLKEMKGSRTLLRKAVDGTLLQWLEDRKLTDKAGGWLKLAAPLRGLKMIEYHKTWIYSAKLFGFEIVGGIQSKPGVEPGPKHLADLRKLIAAEKVKAIIVDNFYPTSIPNALAQDTGIKVAVVPGQPGGEAGTDDYVDFMTHVLQKMVEAVR